MSEDFKSRGIPAQTVYSTKKEYQPDYRFQRIPLINVQGGKITISPNAQSEITIKQPISVFNNARAFLDYDLKCDLTAGKAHWIREDVVAEFQTVQYGTSSDYSLYNMNYVNKRMKVDRKLRTKFIDYQTSLPMNVLYPSNKLRNGFSLTVGGVAAVSVELKGELAVPATVAGNNGTATTNNFINYNRRPNIVNTSSAPCNALFGLASNNNYDGCISNYIEPQYLASSTVGGNLYRHRQVSLSAFGDIFALDKDVYFGQEMTINMMTSVGSQIIWDSVSESDPSDTVTAVAKDITLENFYMYLPIEKNPVLEQSIKAKFNSGNYKMQIPFTVPFKNNAAAASALNFQIPITRQYGKKIKKIMTLAFHGNENTSGQHAFNAGNFDGQKIVQYRTFWNNVPNTDNPLSCKFHDPSAVPAVYNDDWRENQRHCLDSVIFNQGIYALDSWFHIDDFGIKSKHYEDDENLDVGKELGQTSELYLWESTTGTVPVTTYTFITFLKDVAITPQGIMVI